MPAFDLRYLQVAKYTKSSSGNTATYGTPVSMGDAMTVNLEMRFAEGRLYAESALAEYMKKATGGTASAGVKYIPLAAQKLMFNAYEKKRTVSTKPVNSTTFGKKSTGQYVGWSFYAPDMIDGAEKFTAVFVHKVLFGPPSNVFQTMGDNITFQTPTTTATTTPTTSDVAETPKVDTATDVATSTDASTSTDTAGTDASTGTVDDATQTLINEMKAYMHQQYATATDQSEKLKQMYEANLNSQKAQLESNYNESLSGLDSEQEQLAQQYQEAQRQTTADSAKAKANWNETANAYGLNSGTQGQAQLALNNQLQSDLTTLYQTEMQKRAEIERQRQLLGQQYQSAIQEAQANNDMQLAQALYDEAVRVDESITDEGIEMISQYVSLLGGTSSDTSSSSSGSYYGGSSGGSYYGGTSTSATSGEDWAANYRSLWNKIVEDSKADGYGTTPAGILEYLRTNKHYKTYGLNGTYLASSVDNYVAWAEKEKGTYYVNSKLGKEYIEQLKNGDMDSVTVSDGTTWKYEDGQLYAYSEDGTFRNKIEIGKAPASASSGSSSASSKSSASSASGGKATPGGDYRYNMYEYEKY